MKIHKGTAELDVQPSRVGRYLDEGWKRGPAASPKKSASETRDELDERARKAGVDAPEKLPNKAAVEAAIAEQA